MIDWARSVLLAACLSGAVACTAASRQATGSVPGFASVHDTTAFLTPPYLQLGAAPSEETLTLLWHAAPGPARWQVEVGRGGRGIGVPAATARR